MTPYGESKIAFLRSLNHVPVLLTFSTTTSASGDLFRKHRKVMQPGLTSRFTKEVLRWKPKCLRVTLSWTRSISEVIWSDTLVRASLASFMDAVLKIRATRTFAM